MSINYSQRFRYWRGRPGFPPPYPYPYYPYPYAQPYPYTPTYPYGQYPPSPYQQPPSLQPGPSVPPTGTCPQGALPYTVQSGDTLENIASRLGISPDAITSINPGVNFSVPLQNGQSLCLPAEQ